METLSLQRPWQGTFLGVLAWVNFGLFLIGAFMMFFAQSMLIGFLGGIMNNLPAETATEMPLLAGGVTGVLGGLSVFFAVVFLAVAILYFYYARGLFKGRRWTLILTIVIISMPLLMSILTNELLMVAIIGACLYFPVSILRHPFYNPTH